MWLSRRRRNAVLRVVVAASAVAGVFFILHHKRGALIRESLAMVETLARRGTGLTVRVGGVSGELPGQVRLLGVEVRKPWLPPGQQVLFKAEEIRFRYRLMDFLAKRPNSKVQVEVLGPEIRWFSYPGLRRRSLPFVGWVKEMALSQRKHLVLQARNMTCVMGFEQTRLDGVEAYLDEGTFRLKVPLNHVQAAGTDISTTLNVEGRMEWEFYKREDAVTGVVRTEATVINWQPLPREASFDFVFANDRLHVGSSDFLGLRGFAQVDFAEGGQMDISVKGENVSMSDFNPLFNIPKEAPLTGAFDLDSRLYGDWNSPRVVNRARIYKGWMGRNFKAMDVNFSGVIPTVQLTDSRILLEDGSTMKFADKTLEIGDFFRSKTYETLISDAQQDTFVWKGWEISRPGEADVASELLMQRPLGERARLLFRKLKPDDLAADTSEPREHEVEVGLEYRLRSKDLLRFQVREDEEFVSVERKVRF